MPRRMTNEMLAHELLIDPKFSLEQYNGENHVNTKIQGLFYVSSKS
jgi:hypothetical protein